MPNQEKVLRKAHSVLSASVMPTLQASMTPSDWKRISIFKLPKNVSNTPEYYAITIYGEAYSYTTCQAREVEIQRVYRTCHPSIAIGFAVTDFFRDHCRAQIHNVEILKHE